MKRNAGWGRMLGATMGVFAISSVVAAIGPTFSVDWQGALNFNTPGIFAAPDGFGSVATTNEGAILTTAPPGPPGPNQPVPGPIPFPPGVLVDSLPGAPGGVFAGGLGIIPSALNGALELDALSYGRDQITPKGSTQQPMGGNRVFFSVDEFATGFPGGAAPDVFSEGAFGATEASADVFEYLGAYGPLPGAIPPGPWNVDRIDGDGVPPFGGPGTGLFEPNPPTPGDGGMFDLGDNLDAVDLETTLADVAGPIFFSLDSGFPDPLEVAAGPPPNNGTAVANGVSGADVLISFAGGAPAPFIPGPALGLDLAGFDTDDLDALALQLTGAGMFPMPGPPGSSAAGFDEILFSVRRGSAVIGAPDSAFGIPIEAGDILTVPVPGGAPTPSIYIFAEQLGLATVRSGTAQGFGDDLDALDVTPEPTSLVLMLLTAAGLSLWNRRRA